MAAIKMESGPEIAVPKPLDDAQAASSLIGVMLPPGFVLQSSVEILRCTRMLQRH